MTKTLHVLIVDDSPDDAELLLLELQRGGYTPRHQRIDKADQLIAAIDGQEWDLVIADYTMPGFSGEDALAIVRGRNLDVPFIFVSGTIGEDTAVRAMKAGAQDYVTKGNLKRLLPAISRELREAKVRKEHAQGEIERRRAEEKLKQLSRAVEQSANMVIITDVSGHIEYVNPKVLVTMGYSRDEVIGETPSLWKSGTTSDADYENLWQTVLSGQDWRGEFKNRCKDGRLVIVSTTISPIKDDDGNISHFIAIEEDVTHKRETEAQLQHVQKMEAIGQLTGGLAHDFNNLLTIIIGNLDLLEGDLRSNPQAAELANTALSAGLRGAELTKQLLAFTRRQSLESKTFDLNGLVSGVTDLMRRTLGEHIEIESALANDLWPVFTDAAQVESALLNLAVNARDAMPNGGRLVIETANRHLDETYAQAHLDVVSGDYVMLAVSDNGTGIAPDVLEHVFEPFFTSKEKGKGSGLGLSMVYGFIKQSQGHIKIYSEVGYGTTVRLYLPTAKDIAIPIPLVLSVNSELPTGNATILVVEDNADVRKVVVHQLGDFGYRVIEAESPAVALSILKENQPIDLLFTDIVMPGGMTGIELAAVVHDLRPSLKVVFTSGFSEMALRNDIPGDRLVLGKPYRKQDLARKIRDALQKNGV